MTVAGSIWVAVTLLCLAVLVALGTWADITPGPLDHAIAVGVTLALAATALAVPVLTIIGGT